MVGVVFSVRVSVFLSPGSGFGLRKRRQILEGSWYDCKDSTVGAPRFWSQLSNSFDSSTASLVPTCRVTEAVYTYRSVLQQYIQYTCVHNSDSDVHLLRLDHLTVNRLGGVLPSRPKLHSAPITRQPPRSVSFDTYYRRTPAHRSTGRSCRTQVNLPSPPAPSCWRARVHRKARHRPAKQGRDEQKGH